MRYLALLLALWVGVFGCTQANAQQLGTAGTYVPLGGDVSSNVGTSTGTTTSRALAAHLLEIHSAEDWRYDPSAKANRTDTATVQAAMASGATEILLPKKYVLTTALGCPTAGNIHFRGIGRDLSGFATDPTNANTNSLYACAGRSVVTAAAVNAAGTGGTAGSGCILTGTSGPGTAFTASGTVGSSGTLTSIDSIVTAGAYTKPIGLGAEPVTSSCGLTGATLALTMTGLQDNVSFQDMSFWGNWGAPDPSNAGSYLYSNSPDSAALVFIFNTNTVNFDNVAFRNSRWFSLEVRFSSNVNVSNYIVQNSVRDGLAIWDASQVRIHNGYHRGANDDSISISLGIDAVSPRTMVSIDNIDLVDAEGIDVNGSKITSISNIRSWRGHSDVVQVGAYVSGSTGESPNWAININNIQDYDPINRVWFQSAANGGGASGPGYPAVFIRALPFQQGGAAAVPGFPDPSTGIPVSSTPYMYENSAITSGLPLGALAGLHISHVIQARSLSPVSAYSNWGYGPAFCGIAGWCNYAVAETNLASTGMEFDGPIWDADISDFDLSTGGYGIVFASSASQGQAWQDNLFRRFKVAHGRIHNTPRDAIQFTGQTALTHQDVKFDDIDFDPDSAVTAYGRGKNASGILNGTWTSAAPGNGLYAVDAAYVAGLSVVRSTFRDMPALINETGVPAGSNFYDDNVIYGQPAVQGFSRSNKGVGTAPPPGPDWWYVFEDSDPSSATYRQVLNAPIKTAAAMPSSGYYLQGMFVAAQNTAYAASGLPGGWYRLTTTNTHNAVTTLTRVAAGSGGTDGTYNLTFTGSGSGAAGTAVVSGGAITTVTRTAGGSGYQSAPTVVIDPTSGVTGSSITAAYSQDWVETFWR